MNTLFVNVLILVVVLSWNNVRSEPNEPPVPVWAGPSVYGLPVTKVSAFIEISNRIYITTKSRQVYVLGHKHFDAKLLGLGTDPSNVYTPQELPQLTNVNIVKLCGGERHMLALSLDGNIWSWGSNDLGQLGQESTDPLRPQMLAPSYDHVVDIECGSNVSFAITKNGNVYAWGCYPLQTNSTVYRQPTKLSISNITQLKITSNDLFIFAMTTCRHVLQWGRYIIPLEEHPPKRIQLASGDLLQAISIAATTDYGFILGLNGRIHVRGPYTEYIISHHKLSETVKAIHGDRVRGHNILLARSIDEVVHILDIRDTQSWNLLDASYSLDEYSFGHLSNTSFHMSFMAKPVLPRCLYTTSQSSSSSSSSQVGPILVLLLLLAMFIF